MFVFSGGMQLMSSVKGSTAVPGPVEYALLAGVSLTWGTSYMFTKIGNAASFHADRLSLCGCCGRFAFDRGRQAFVQAPYITGSGGLCSGRADVECSTAFVDCDIRLACELIGDCDDDGACAVDHGNARDLFRGELPKPRNIAGILVGLVGIVLLFGPAALLDAGESARGALAAVGAALVFSSALFAMTIVRHHDPLTVTAGSLTAAALWMFPLALLVDGVPEALPSAGVAGAVVTLGLLNTALSSLMLFALVPRAGATFTSYNNYLVPVIAVLCGTVFLGEPLTAQSALGVIVVAGWRCDLHNQASDQIGKAFDPLKRKTGQ
jgi:hypothetical protein